MSKQTKALLTILGLILVTTAALATMQARNPISVVTRPSGGDRVAISMEAVQDKVLQGGDGEVTVALNLRAPHLDLNDERSCYTDCSSIATFSLTESGSSGHLRGIKITTK